MKPTVALVIMLGLCSLTLCTAVPQEEKAADRTSLTQTYKGLEITVSIVEKMKEWTPQDASYQTPAWIKKGISVQVAPNVPTRYQTFNPDKILAVVRTKVRSLNKRRKRVSSMFS